MPEKELTPPTAKQMVEGLEAGAKKRICCAAQEEQEAAMLVYAKHLKAAHEELGGFEQF